MKTLKQTILGDSPITTILGFLAGAIAVIQEMVQAGETDWVKITLAIITGMIGRAAADDFKK